MFDIILSVIIGFLVVLKLTDALYMASVWDYITTTLFFIVVCCIVLFVVTITLNFLPNLGSFMSLLRSY